MLLSHMILLWTKKNMHTTSWTTHRVGCHCIRENCLAIEEEKSNSKVIHICLGMEILMPEPLSLQIGATFTCVRDGGRGQDDPLSMGCRSPTVRIGPQTLPETGRSFSQMKRQAGSLNPKF